MFVLFKRVFLSFSYTVNRQSRDVLHMRAMPHLMYSRTKRPKLLDGLPADASGVGGGSAPYKKNCAPP